MWPHLEVRPNGVDLVDEILNADDAVLPQVRLNDRVVGEGNALLVGLPVAALVHKLLHLHARKVRTDAATPFRAVPAEEAASPQELPRPPQTREKLLKLTELRAEILSQRSYWEREGARRLEVRVAIHHVGLNAAEHVHRRLVGAHEDAVVNLAEAEKLEDLLRLGVDLVNTPEADDEEELRLRLDVEAPLHLGSALEAHEVGLSRPVLLHVLLSALEDSRALSAGRLLLGGGLGGLGLRPRVIALPLLEERLRTRGSGGAVKTLPPS